MTIIPAMTAASFRMGRLAGRAALVAATLLAAANARHGAAFGDDSPPAGGGWRAKSRPAGDDAPAPRAGAPKDAGDAGKKPDAAESGGGRERAKPLPPAPGGANAGGGKRPRASMLPASSGTSLLAAEKAAVESIDASTSIAEILAATLPPRSDDAVDWSAGPEALHRCGEPRWIEPCIPPPPCHPSLAPMPLDLVGVAGDPTSGPIYRGPCCPRTGTHDDGPWAGVHRIHDRLFDAFYRTK